MVLRAPAGMQATRRAFFSAAAGMVPRWHQGMDLSSLPAPGFASRTLPSVAKGLRDEIEVTRFFRGEADLEFQDVRWHRVLVAVQALPERIGWRHASGAHEAVDFHGERFRCAGS